MNCDAATKRCRIRGNGACQRAWSSSGADACA